ncbi:MAG: NYN domain-containing protein [Vicinamibacteria bacterium]|nr:NYN domain-containing protein [Vicinamibacteria bacterium]
MAAPNQDEQRIALFIDFENIAIGVRDAHYRKFDINLVLERLLDKGKLLVKKAYADWTRYSDYKRSFHEAAIELIEVPQKSVGGKNSADIRLVVDAMDLSFQKEHINCFVVASGDSDFSPLVSKLKENDKHVIGLGVKNSTSDLLTENCDEFIFYEDLVRARQRPMPQLVGNLPEKIQECFSLLVDSVLALQRENKESLWGSMVKETMKRKRPSFNETYYGYRTFSHLLEDAQRKGIVTLRRDQRSGSYVIEDLGSGAVVGGGAAVATTAAAPATSTRESRGTHTPVSSPAVSAEAGSEVAAPGEEGEAGGEAGERGERGPRRRRGRGRRGRGGAASDATAPEDNESDEGESTEDEAAPAMEAAPAENSEPVAPRAEEPARTERGLFSLFSWARREPAAPDEKKKED